MPLDIYNPVKVNPQKLVFIHRVLSELAVEEKQIFTPETLSNIHSGNTSIGDLLSVYKNLSRIDYPALGIELGRRIRAKDYGLYGSVLLCRETLESAIRFSVRYHDMVTRTTRMYLEGNQGGDYFFGYEDVLGISGVTSFNLEFQCAINLSLIRDILGEADYAPKAVLFEAQKPNDPSLYEQFFQCEVVFGSELTGLVFTKAQLATPLPKSNDLAIPILLKSCDEALQKQLAGNSFLLTIYKWVSENVHTKKNATNLAEHLCITERTLRRKLAEHGIRYSDICTEVKTKLAHKYVCETSLSMDDIATSLGFSDTANFRRAFKQWTKKGPTQYRKEHLA